MVKIITRNGLATKGLAANLARKILRSPLHKKHARVLALVGDLGAGKTTFTQGFAKALGIKHRMVSPTFLIFRNYKLRNQNSKLKTFYHVDVYRIHSAKELEPLHFKKLLQNPENIVLIEWADKIKKVLPKDAIWVRLEHGKKENQRIIEIKI